MPRYYNRALTRAWRRGFYRRSTYARQKSGNRYFNISFPVETVVALTVPANQSFTNVLRTSPYMCRIGTSATDPNVAAAAASLMESKAYRTYVSLYDSVKINSVSLNFSVATTIGEGGIPGIRCYTSWDRDLLKSDGVITEDDLLNGPESQAVTFINNSRAKFNRYNRAQDLQERSTFHDCTIVYSANDYRADEYWISPNQTTGRSVGYCPSLSLVIQCSNTVATTRTIPIQLQAVYNVTFRNPKYGLSSSVVNSKMFGDDEKKESDEKEMEEEPVLKKKKVVYEEEVIPDDEKEEDDDDELNPIMEESQSEPFQEPVTVSKPVAVKKAGKKSSG